MSKIDPANLGLLNFGQHAIVCTTVIIYFCHFTDYTRLQIWITFFGVIFLKLISKFQVELDFRIFGHYLKTTGKTSKIDLSKFNPDALVTNLQATLKEMQADKERQLRHHEDKKNVRKSNPTLKNCLYIK